MAEFGLIGNQRLTGVGNLVPTDTALRIFSLDAHSSISTSSLVLHNGLVSSTTATIYLVFGSDSQGNYHYTWHDGVYFPDGVWLDTGAAASTYAIVIGYARVMA